VLLGMYLRRRNILVTKGGRIMSRTINKTCAEELMHCSEKYYKGKRKWQFVLPSNNIVCRCSVLFQFLMWIMSTLDMYCTIF
jgi:hypothetical protein